MMRSFPTAACVVVFLIGGSLTTAAAQRSRGTSATAAIPTNILLRIIRAEDERRWDNDLALLLTDKDARVRKRAALAAGRIGDERAVPVLTDLLRGNDDVDVRQMAAFALGEIESPSGAEALIVLLDDTRDRGEVRARAVEALGKIGAALLNSAPASGDQTAATKPIDDRPTKIKVAILDALKFEAGRRSMSDDASILLGLTAALRTKPEGAGPVIVRFLGYSDPRIVAGALNTMARLRLKDGNEQVRQLLGNGDPIVRANAARVLGAAEDKASFDALLDRALHDSDLRVRVSAIRALGSLKDGRAAEPLLDRGAALMGNTAKAANIGRPSEFNELLEIATTLGQLLRNSNLEKAIDWLSKVRARVGNTAPAVEIAFARIAPHIYMLTADNPLRVRVADNEIDIARRQVSIAQGLLELANVKTGRPALDIHINELATNLTHDSLECRTYQPPATRPTPSKAGKTRLTEAVCTLLQPKSVPDFLRTYAALKPKDLVDMLRERLKDGDVIIRATAAELLGEMPPNEANTRALIDALPRALRDEDLNDAALAILDALAKQKTAAANDAIKTALDSSDHLIRRKAVALLKANGVGDFTDRIGFVKTRNTEADYRRAIARIGKHVTATVETSKGSFTIEFLPEDAPLNVDNFIELARKGFFNGQTIPRVVPNFVVQAGDPRGDTNGGPGYQIRCEINEVPYDRAAVGMALSGKDTGGSQWFVTHSPQPHLDGGYTVFGRVVAGMEVVDRIARGDIIRRATVSER